jgi:hypothetical protein
MAIIATARSEGTTFEPAPGGVHQAVCVDVVDMGVLEVTYAGVTKKQHKVRLVWQIEELMDDGKPFIVQKRYTLSLNEKATLRKDLEGWRGRSFTDAELAGFDLEVLVGINCLLNVVQRKPADRTYANVEAVMPLKRGMEKLTPRGYVRVKDRDPQQPHDREDAPPITEDDIPFAWVMPLLVPAASLLTLGGLIA